jgi:hypothetical protein
MGKDEIAAALQAAGIKIVSEARNGNDNGWRLCCVRSIDKGQHR